MTRLQEKFIVDAKGKKVAVIVPLRRYQKLLEDLHDLAAIVERTAEPSVSFDKTIKKARGNSSPGEVAVRERAAGSPPYRASRTLWWRQF